jgi:predicted nucleotidyltransferase
MYIKVVEKELKHLVSILEKYVPKLKEVRVLGSYENGGFDKCADIGIYSDIDVFVLTGDRNLSAHKDRRGFEEFSLESAQRATLRYKITSNLKGKYKKRFSLSVCTPSDLRWLMEKDDGRGNIGMSMKNGRLLYPQK